MPRQRKLLLLSHPHGRYNNNKYKKHYTTPPITYAANNNNIAIPRNNPSVWNWHHPHSNESAARNTLPRQEDHPTPIIILMTIIYPTASHRTLQSPNTTITHLTLLHVEYPLSFFLPRSRLRRRFHYKGLRTVSQRRELLLLSHPTGWANNIVVKKTAREVGRSFF